MRRVLVVLVLLSGCGYMGVHRKNAVNTSRRRVVGVAVKAKQILVALSAPIQSSVVAALDPEHATVDVSPPQPIPLDVQALSEEELAELMDRIYMLALGIKMDADRTDGWLKAMELDFGAVDEAEELELGSDAEHAANTDYHRSAGSKAYRRGWWRALVSRYKQFKRFISRTAFYIKWGIRVGLVLLAGFGAYQWWGRRFFKKAAREGIDALSQVKKESRKKVTKGRGFLGQLYEGDRTWRKKRELREKR